MGDILSLEACRHLRSDDGLWPQIKLLRVMGMDVPEIAFRLRADPYRVAKLLAENSDDD